MNADETYQQLTARYDMVVEGFRFLLDDTEKERDKFPARFLKQINSPIHGIDHWARVCLYGLDIGNNLWVKQQVDTRVFVSHDKFEQAIIHAAFFHDCARITEGCEFDHGRWAEKVWRSYSGRKGFEEGYTAAISEALLLHVENVKTEAGALAISLCNGDRLDRIRLGELPDPKRMYVEDRWLILREFSIQLFQEYNFARAKNDMIRIKIKIWFLPIFIFAILMYRT